MRSERRNRTRDITATLIALYCQHELGDKCQMDDPHDIDERRPPCDASCPGVSSVLLRHFKSQQKYFDLVCRNIYFFFKNSIILLQYQRLWYGNIVPSKKHLSFELHSILAYGWVGSFIVSQSTTRTKNFCISDTWPFVSRVAHLTTSAPNVNSSEPERASWGGGAEEGEAHVDGDPVPRDHLLRRHLPCHRCR